MGNRGQQIVIEDKMLDKLKETLKGQANCSCTVILYWHLYVFIHVLTHYFLPFFFVSFSNIWSTSLMMEVRASPLSTGFACSCFLCYLLTTLAMDCNSRVCFVLDKPLSGRFLSVKGTYFCQFKLILLWSEPDLKAFVTEAAAPAHVVPHAILSSSVQTLTIFEYLLGEVRASIVVGQLLVLLTLMNLKMPSNLWIGSTRAAWVCEKKPQFVQQILPSLNHWPLPGQQAQVPLEGAIPTLNPNSSEHLQ